MAKVTNIRIRMYRQGFGDCFLLSFRDANNKNLHHMLIDCGVFLGSPDAGPFMNQVAADIAETIKDADGKKRLDTLVVTHEHWDHLSGFSQAAGTFENLDIDNLWLAWTEDPGNALAKELKGIKEQKLRALTWAAQQFGALGLEEQKTKVDGILEFFGPLAAGKRQSTADILDSLQKEIPATFLEPGKEILTLPGLEGIRFYILGPPEDSELIKRSEVRAGDKKDEVVYAADPFGRQSLGFLAATGSLDGDEEDQLYQPFDAEFRIPEKTAKRAAFFRDRYFKPALKWRAIDHEWLKMAENLALALDGDTNNTSLVLAIEFVKSGKVLLFPGDAQVGNWQSWFNYSWTTPEKPGEPVTAAQLLKRTVLYKVGHHGSHNATLRKQGLELMTNRDLVALIPVSAAFAAGKGWEIPYEPLHKEIIARTKGRVLQSDRPFPKGATKPAGLGKKEWADFKKKVVVDDLFFDFEVSDG